MRTAVRPLLFFVLLCGFTAAAQSGPVPGGGINVIAFAAGTPTPTVGGVDVTVTQKATTGYTCTEIIVRVIDDKTGKTLATEQVTNPANSISKSFAGFGSGTQIQVTADGTFQKGTTFDFPFIQQVVTTK